TANNNGGGGGPDDPTPTRPRPGTDADGARHTTPNKPRPQTNTDSSGDNRPPQRPRPTPNNTPDPDAPRGAGGLSDDVLRLAESNVTSSGETVLGSVPGYITKAKSRGASYFDIGDTWNALTPAQRTAANNHFLDVIAARGDRVLLSTSKTQIQAGTSLADEVAYLTGEKGYVWVNQWSLRPGG
ncbi:MAG: hypothetical protein GY788_13030, partial [bacterium]|nr:hypothetical protein [bacterium]